MHVRAVRNILFVIVLVAVVGGLGALVAWRLAAKPEAAPRSGVAGSVVPVQVAEVHHGTIEDRRVFSGSLEATARVTMAPKISGRIMSLRVDISDPVQRGQVIALLDSAEYEQTVAQADAEVAVAQAEHIAAESGLKIAQRELERVRTLHERGIASDSQLDTATADQMSLEAGVQVAVARVQRAQAALESARIRLGYTSIRAEWEGGDDARVVAERFVDEGDTVSANAPIVSIIELNPILAVIHATERDYALLEPEQSVTLSADAYPGQTFAGRVARVSPIFREGSRQARVEVIVPNPESLLKPGMFVRVEAILGRAEDAAIVPVEALAERNGGPVLFLVDDTGTTARMLSVQTGIRQGARVQITSPSIDGRVVTLGQQLLGESTSISIPTPGAERHTDVTAPDAVGAGNG